MLFDQIYEEIVSQIKTSLGLKLEQKREAPLVLETPPSLDLGDFAFPTFKLAKELKKAPPLIAAQIHESIVKNQSLTRKCEITTTGPYINFKIKKEFLLEEVLSSLLVSEDDLAQKTLKNPQSVVIEFSSPNIAKPFNIYHLRSTMIGHTLCKIYQTRGFKPIAINHLGDWGTQFGVLALAYEMWGNEQELQKTGISYLVELYVRIHKEFEKNPELEKKAQEYFSKLEKGDLQVKAYWEKFVQLSLKEYEQMYQRLGVHFDFIWGESFYISQIPKLEERLLKESLLTQSDGAKIVNLDAFGMPPCIIQKKDGSSIYATRDLAAAWYRYEKFQFSKMLYVVGAEQKLHFKQIFKVLELLKCDWAKNCEHVDFGIYRFQTSEKNFEKMSTRKGTFVTMKEVLDLAVQEVENIMEKKNSQSSAQEKKEFSEIIGVGAIIFNDLSTDRIQDVNFDLKQVLDFDGETGPYIQYAHTRCLSILKNAPSVKTDNLLKASLLKLEAKEEIHLLKKLARFPLVLDSVLEHSKPSLLAHFLIDITKAFNLFYRTHKVLTDDSLTTQARLALVLATQKTLKKGLFLLGIKTPLKM